MLKNKIKDVIIVAIAILLAITVLGITAIELKWYYLEKNYFCLLDGEEDTVYDRIIVYLPYDGEYNLKDIDAEDFGCRNIKSIEYENSSITIFLKRPGKRQTRIMILEIRDLDFVGGIDFYYE